MRAFIVDNAPWHQQKSANAWASRVSQAAGIISYAFGCMNLPSIFPILGKTQFQVLTVLATCTFTVCLFVSCFFIEEAKSDHQAKRAIDLKIKSPIRMIWNSARHVSPQIKNVFAIQFASWFGWCSFLFYVTTYIGQLYVNPIFDKNRDLSEREIEKAWKDATRLATSAFVMNAVVSFVGSIVLPLLVTKTSSEKEDKASEDTEISPESSQQKSPFAIYLTTSLRLLRRLSVPGLTLRRLWLLSHFLFAGCMFSTFFITSPRAASVMTAIVGIPWMITSWAPFAIIATELAQNDAGRKSTGEAEDGVAPQSSGELNEDHSEAGVVLGLHNVFISSPQIISSIVSGVVFKILQKPRGEPFDDSVAWVMRIGGCAALVAGLLTIPLQEQVS